MGDVRDLQTDIFIFLLLRLGANSFKPFIQLSRHFQLKVSVWKLKQ